MAKFKKRLKAHRLRRKGLSIKSIAEKLDVSKSTASIWCRDMKLTKKEEKRLLKNAVVAGHKGRIMGAETNRRKKQKIIDFYKKSAIKSMGVLSDRDILIAGTALYWGEGSKSGKLAFSNSDPIMIKFMFKWFQKIMGVKKNDFMPRIFINEMHKPRIEKVLSFWSSWLKLPKKQFGNPAFIKTPQRKIYENYEYYYGILSIRIRKSMNLQYRIFGLINALKK